MACPSPCRFRAPSAPAFPTRKKEEEDAAGAAPGGDGAAHSSSRPEALGGPDAAASAQLQSPAVGASGADVLQLTANRDELQWDELQWKVTVSNLLTSKAVAVIKASPDQRLYSLARLMGSSNPSREEDDTAFVFVDGAKVLPDTLMLREVRQEHPCHLSVLVQSHETAELTQRKAKREHLAAKLEDYAHAVPRALSRERFGESLASRAYEGLGVGRSIAGRVRFCMQEGVVSRSVEEKWELRRGRIE